VPQISAPEDEVQVQKQRIGTHIPLDRSEPSLQGRQNLGNSAFCCFELTFLTHFHVPSKTVHDMRLEVLTVMFLETEVFWDVVLWWSVSSSCHLNGCSALIVKNFLPSNMT